MIRTSHRLFVAAALAAGLIAGCGGGGKSTTTTTTKSTAAAKTTHTSSTTSTPSSTSSTATTTTTTSSKGATGGAGALNSAAVAQYCEGALATATGVSSTERNELKAYCSALAHDTPAQLKAAEKTLCEQILQYAPSSEQAIVKAECSKL